MTRIVDLSRVVVEVDGPHHYSVEPAAFGSGGGGDLDDWFGGGGGLFNEDDATSSSSFAVDTTGGGLQTPGVGPEGDGLQRGGIAHTATVAGGRWPLGSTVLRNQLLRSWGWTVVTVPYHEWEKLVTGDDKKEYVGHRLLEIGVASPTVDEEEEDATD